MPSIERIISARIKFIPLFILLLVNEFLQGQIITTFAGNGTYGYSGNGGPATSAQLAWPIGVATDNAGNVYIADHDNNVIRKVNSAGIITTFAGTGTLGYSGDGGPAVSANLYHPAVITLDNAGNLYFTDQNAEVIRKINGAGTITSITGNLGPGYSGDNGPLMLAQFRSISGICFDNAGNLYISDFSNDVIRKVNTSGTINTFAGSGVAGFGGDGGPATAAKLDGPYGVVIRSNGNVFIPDAHNNRIRVVNTAGIINTYAGTGTAGYSGDNGPAASATMNFPWHSTIDPTGNIYVVDPLNDVVRKIDNSAIITTIAGNGTNGYSGDGGPATAAQMTDECGIACDNAGNIYVVNRNPVYVVRKVTTCLNAVISQQPINVTLCNSGNTSFTITASNASTYQWQLNTGSGWNNLTDNSIYAGSNTATLSITNANPAMNNYQYQCAIANTCGTIYSTAAVLAVNASVTPSLLVTSSSSNICAGSLVTFSASPTNGGAAPLYQWQKNGSPVGTNSNSYTDNSLINGDIINCILTSNALCLTTFSATSNNIVMSVTANTTAAVSIVSSATTICAGSNVIFTASPANGGANPSYQWQVHGINVGTNSSTYSSSSLVDGDFVRVIMTGNLACASPSSATSNLITMTVMSPATPTVSIEVTSSLICPGTNVAFQAITFNAGSNPSYQWQINGGNVGPNFGLFTTTGLVNGDIVRVIMTSNQFCVSPQTATSNSILITVNSFTTASVAIATPSTTVCSGANATFTSIPTNGGATPGYQWQVNGVNAGTNSSTFTTNALANGDVVNVIMTTNLACASPPTSTSNSIPITVTPSSPASVNIDDSYSGNPCAGTLVTITAFPTNGGFTPNYQWQVNGVNFGPNAPVITSQTFADGDMITVTMTSSLACALPSIATSTAPIRITALPILPLAVSIAASSSNICSSTPVTFTATSTNGGSSPVYQWQLNGTNVGSNSISYTSAVLANGDLVTVKMTSNTTCPLSNPVISSPVTMVVNSPVQPSISIVASPAIICPQSKVTFTAFPVSGGNNPSYQWKLNGLIVGSNSIKYIIDSLKNGDIVGCSLTSNAGCVMPNQVGSNDISIAIDPDQCPKGFFIPNAFTPNKDGKNDLFMPLLFGNVVKYKFLIYDRWGQKIFETNELQKGWDGKLSGVDQDTNVFVWLCTFQFEGQGIESRKGTFVLIR